MLRKFKYTPTNVLTYRRLTVNKVYDVININKELNRVELINDENENELFNIRFNERRDNFIDVTSEYRNRLIDDILK